MPRLALLTLSALVGSVGGITLAWALADLVTAVGSRRWSSVTGVVTDLRFEANHAEDFEWYKPILVYEYVVGDKAYLGHRQHIGQGTLIRTWLSTRGVKQLLAELPIGQQVKVYFDPQRPSASTLRVGPSASHAVLIALGVFLICLAGAFLVS